VFCYTALLGVHIRCIAFELGNTVGGVARISITTSCGYCIFRCSIGGHIKCIGLVLYYSVGGVACVIVVLFGNIVLYVMVLYRFSGVLYCFVCGCFAIGLEIWVFWPNALVWVCVLYVSA
jgi:hypothetical protein